MREEVSFKQQEEKTLLYCRFTLEVQRLESQDSKAS